MACFKVSSEKGTLIFAIINIVVVGFGFLINMGLFNRTVVAAIETPPERFSYIGMIVLGVIQCFYLICLVCSSLLLDGILNKKPAFLKVYCNFGVIMVMLSSAPVLTVMVDVIRSHFGHYIAIFVIYGVYLSILYMIRHASIKIETGRKPSLLLILGG